MNFSRYICLSLAVLLVGGGLLVARPAFAEDVVFLHTHKAPTTWTQSIIDGLTAVLGKNYSVRQESLGKTGLDEESLDDDFERLHGVYADTQPVAVVANGHTAFAFMRKYGEELFPGIPMIFASIPPPSPDLLGQCSECTGIPLEPDVQGTVDAIFDLTPDASLVVGIMDGSRESLALRQSMENAMEPFMDRAQIIFPGFEPGDDAGMTMESLREVASSIPGSAAVLFLGLSGDMAGNPMDEKAAVMLLVGRSAAPVFVMTDDWFELGVLGGSVASGKAHGREVAGLIQRIQAGEPAREMLPQPPAPQLTMDGTVAARFGVKLPSGVRVVNPPDRPDDTGGTSPTGVAGWAIGLIVFAGLLFVLRRFTGRSSKSSERRP